MPKKFFVFILPLLISLAKIAHAQDVIDEFPKGSINWSKGTISASGSGAPPPSAGNMAQARLLAERAAVSDARRNLLEIAGEVRVDAVSTVSSLMTKSDVIITKVSGIIKGSSVTSKKYLEDGSVEVTVEMPVTGAFLDVMLTEVKATPSVTMTMALPRPKKKDVAIETKITPLPVPEIKKSAPEPIPAPPQREVKPATEPAKPATPAVPQEPVIPPAPKEPAKEARPQAPERLDLSKINYSGLIIDAREVEVKPALMPKITDEKGAVIYSSANMQKEEAVKTGVVGYAKEVDAARKHPRVTETPVVLAALRGSGENRSDVVISDRDAAVITTTEPALGYLKKGRVMIVYK